MSGTYINLPPAEGGGGSGFITAVTDTNSIDLTVTVTTLSAAVNLSSTAATAGFFKATTTIKGGGSPGIHVELPIATTLLTGVISATDWNTFNNKQAPITAGTTADYWRGDKTFQLLQMSALTAVTAGTPAATGKIGEVLRETQASNTTTGVGLTGDYGSVISIDLDPGSYYLMGVAGFSENGAVLTTGLQVGISDDAAGAGISEFDTSLFPGILSSTSDLLLATPGVFIDISAPTTYYLNTKFYYTSGSPEHRGQITAWRIR